MAHQHIKGHFVPSVTIITQGKNKTSCRSKLFICNKTWRM